MTPIHLIGIVGSLRAASVNREIARAAAAADIDGLTVTLHDVSEVPFYDGDLEEAGPPPPVTALVDSVAGADGVVLFSPEYNGSFPAVTKNVIDWLSRPPKAWTGTGLAMVTATPGPRAGLGVRTHFSAIMEHQPVRLFETLGFGTYAERLTDGRLTDADTVAELHDFLARYADFCRKGLDG